MKWRPEVKVEKKNGCWLVLGKRKIKVADEDAFIVDLMEQGVAEDTDLVKEVSVVTGNDECAAGFRLAQFVEDYGDFIAESRRAVVFGS